MDNVAKLQKENTELKRTLARKDDYIESLEAAIIQANRKRYGVSSEKCDAGQGQLFDEPEVDLDALEAKEKASGSEIAPKAKAQKRKPSIPKSYPREDIVHDLSEEEKICPHDGTPLKPIGFEEHEQFDIIPAQIKVIRHRQSNMPAPAASNTCSQPKSLSNPSKKASPAPACWPMSPPKNTVMLYLCTDRLKSLNALVSSSIVAPLAAGW